MKYIVEDDINFYDELFKNNEKEEESNLEIDNETEICLIERKKLTDGFIRLPCNHTFNYLPLYREVYSQKKKKNHYSIDRLKRYQLKCPYCRTKHDYVLPYYCNLVEEKVDGVNYPEKYCLKLFKCEYVFKSGKNKNTVCNVSCTDKYCKKHMKIVNKSIYKDNTEITCKAILKSGKRKGMVCGCKIKNGNEFCKRHSKLQ